MLALCKHIIYYTQKWSSLKQVLIQALNRVSNKLEQQGMQLL